MAKEINPICRKCRRAGSKLYLKGERCLSTKCSFTRRSYPPGKKGAAGVSFRKSDYGQQLAEKQKIKNIYFVLERQFRNIFKKASQSDNASLELLILLEMRIDNVLRRAGLASSTKSARQLVNHKHIKINYSTVKSSNYTVKIGDKIALDKSALKDIKSVNEVASWLKVDDKKGIIEVTGMPTRDHISQDIKEDLVVELYSR